MTTILYSLVGLLSTALWLCLRALRRRTLLEKKRVEGQCYSSIVASDLEGYRLRFRSDFEARDAWVSAIEQVVEQTEDAAIRSKLRALHREDCDRWLRVVEDYAKRLRERSKVGGK